MPHDQGESIEAGRLRDEGEDVLVLDRQPDRRPSDLDPPVTDLASGLAANAVQGDLAADNSDLVVARVGPWHQDFATFCGLAGRDDGDRAQVDARAVDR